MSCQLEELLPWAMAFPRLHCCCGLGELCVLLVLGCQAVVHKAWEQLGEHHGAILLLAGLQPLLGDALLQQLWQCIPEGSTPGDGAGHLDLTTALCVTAQHDASYGRLQEKQQGDRTQFFVSRTLLPLAGHTHNKQAKGPGLVARKGLWGAPGFSSNTGHELGSLGCVGVLFSPAHLGGGLQAGCQAAAAAEAQGVSQLQQ